MHALGDLLLILPPPKTTPHPAIDWQAVEADLGTTLPTDYKAFISTYGLGRIDDFLLVYHPTAANPNVRLSYQVQRDLRSLRILQNDGADYIRFALCPEPSGLLPWARTIDGDVCYWLTQSDDPDDWAVVVGEVRGPEWAEFHGSMAEFLAAVLTKKYVCPIFPDDFPSARPTFVPFPDGSSSTSTPQ
jgi:hypothetical protein